MTAPCEYARVAIILVVLWLLGVIGVYTIGWFIHILLVVAIIMFLIRIHSGEKSDTVGFSAGDR